MVYGVIAQGLSKAAGTAGAYIITRGFKAFRKYDVKIHRGLYGESGGRGVRHGRDAGSIGASIYQGTKRDDLDGTPFESRNPSRKFDKTYRGRGYKRSRRYNKRCPPCRSRRQPYSR